MSEMHPERNSVTGESGVQDSTPVTSTDQSAYYYSFYPYYPVYSQDAGVYNVYHTWPAAAQNKSKKCGSSTVAIDNKIEQAMDLVKSHLMYAVREEVEVLKEQIKELMDKNSQLEYENQILKSSASPETLAKLSNLPSSSSS